MIGVKQERLAVHCPRINRELVFGGFHAEAQAVDHAFRVVDRRNISAGAGKVNGQRAGSAADVDDALAGSDSKPIDKSKRHQASERLGRLLIIAAAFIPSLRAVNVDLVRHDRMIQDNMNVASRSTCVAGSLSAPDRLRTFGLPLR